MSTNSATDYIVCGGLRDVPNVFNVEDLWHRARRLKQGQFLMELLRRYPRTQRSRHRKTTYFHHVIVRIPAADYARDERMDDGFNREALIRDLCGIHQDKLGDYIPDGETVRYRVEADQALSAGQVRFLFGRAIYLPSAQEQLAYRLYRYHQESIQELGVVYRTQRLVLLNGDPYASTFLVPDWPFAAGESVLLLNKPPQEPVVCAEPDRCLTVKPEGERIFRISDSQQGASLHLRIELNEAPTWTPGENASPSKLRLQVVGIALQRPSLYVKTGLKGWRLGFDQHGALVACQHPHAIAWLRIDGEDRLWGEAQGDPTLLSPPVLWRPSAPLALELNSAPGAMQEHYCAWVRLPQPVPLSAPVVGKWFSFGRSVEADLAPGLLNDPNALFGDMVQPLQPEQLMLSRRHLGLRLDRSRWIVKLESDKWPAYWLDRTGAFVQVLSLEQRRQEFVIESGALLVAGGYVLELGCSNDKANGDQTVIAPRTPPGG